MLARLRKYLCSRRIPSYLRDLIGPGMAFQVDARSHFLFPPSSAMYMISCLKMNRLGAPSRVSRTMFLS